MAFRGKKCNGIFCEWVLVLFFFFVFFDLFIYDFIYFKFSKSSWNSHLCMIWEWL